MTTFALNNLWTYLKNAKQKAYVKETLLRALNEVERAKCGEVKLTTEKEFLAELEEEEII